MHHILGNEITSMLCMKVLLSDDTKNVQLAFSKKKEKEIKKVDISLFPYFSWCVRSRNCQIACRESLNNAATERYQACSSSRETVKKDFVKKKINKRVSVRSCVSLNYVVIARDFKPTTKEKYRQKLNLSSPCPPLSCCLDRTFPKPLGPLGRWFLFHL